MTQDKHDEEARKIVESVKDYKGGFNRETKWLEKDLVFKISTAFEEKEDRITEANIFICAVRTRMSKQDEEIKRLTEKNERQKSFPIQISNLKLKRAYPLRIPWSIAEKAYSVYASRYGTDQSLERLSERGGFGAEEMDEFYPDWINESDRIKGLETDLTALRKENVRLKECLWHNHIANNPESKSSKELQEGFQKWLKEIKVGEASLLFELDEIHKIRNDNATMREALIEAEKAMEKAKVLSQGPSYETADSAMVSLFNGIAKVKQALQESGKEVL